MKQKQDDIIKNYLGDELKKYENVKTIIFNKPEKPKQETLEEVIERLYPENWESIMDGQHDSNFYERNAFIKGVKWQQERSYSEEDIINALHSVELKDNKDYSKIYNGIKQWFEQFKKK